MTDQSQKMLFRLGAVFNWLVGLVLFFNAGVLFELFHISPIPTETVFLRLFAGVVFCFGFGYYWAGNDLATNANVIRLGIVGKLSVVAIAAYEIMLGNISWQFMLVASADLVFAVFFIRALRGLQW